MAEKPKVGKALEEGAAGSLTDPTFLPAGTDINNLLIAAALRQMLGGQGGAAGDLGTGLRQQAGQFFVNPLTAASVFQTSPALLRAGPIIGFVPPNPAARRGMRNLERSATIINLMEDLPRLADSLRQIGVFKRKKKVTEGAGGT